MRHGLKKHPLYSIWCNIKRRCTVPDAPLYYLYGGSGVRICDEWRRDFKAFYDWCIANGWETGLEVDKDFKSKEKPGKLYSPETCAIITSKINKRNKRSTDYLTHNGETLSFQEWAERIGISYRLFWFRIKKQGWSMEKIIENPAPIPHSYILDYKGESLSISECSRRFNISINGLRKRLEKGWGVERALETPLSERHITNKKKAA